ncbi:zinc finger protein 226-like [Eublepharis macularius]|uniref:Zinc finger protein 226-like n=1 Tax=Eublepharis macularius TaxID=481883 RepID=A0AA97LAJ5_EUBMA|nr:zinc finger protein 226-like [Eublepharis macularius]XP_054849092.1 zinc finger protein 226-like [Eublepharis macularius]XP_054849095.1 zinc finger protein 226-like [Eublepharis macularius]
METELITVKEENGSVTLPACCLCQRELPELTGSQEQIPQCQACKRIVLEHRNWLPDNQEAQALPADRPYSCSFCPKCFKRASDRRDHERVHTGERPYGCGICGKRFTQSSVLSGHMRIHTGERPFHCGVCFKSFNNGSNFRKHQRIHSQPYRYGAKGNGGKDCIILPVKKQNQPMEGQNGSKRWQGKILRQNGCQSIKELREGEKNRSCDLVGRQNGPYINRLISPDGSNYNVRQPGENVGHFERMKVKQGATNCGPTLETKHGSGRFKTGDSKGRVGELGENGDSNYDQVATQNGHSFRLVKYASGENQAKGLKPRKSGERHAQGEWKQHFASPSGRLDGVSCGKGLLSVGGNKDHIYKLSQDSVVGGYDLDQRPNGDYLKGLKHNGGKGTIADMRRNGAASISGLRQSQYGNATKLSQNVSHGGHINGMSENSTGHFGELRQDGGISKGKQVNFQACTLGKMNSLLPNVSVRTCPESRDVMAWEQPDTELTKRRDGFDECAPLDRHSSPWEPGISDPCSLPYDLSVSPQSHSLQVQVSSTVQLWEEESPYFPFQDPEPYAQHSPATFDSKPFLCFACPKQFRRATDLKEHLRVHTGERPFGCTVCGKRFTQSSALVTHRRLHTGEKPFECTVCRRRFNNSSNFAKHRRLHLQESRGGGSKAVEKTSRNAKPQ